MKLCRFDDGRIGVVRGRSVCDVTSAVEAALPPRRGAGPRVDALVGALDRLRPLCEAACETAPRLDLASVRLLSPVADPPRVIAVRTNYRGSGESPATEPDLFLKAPSSVVGPSDGVTLRFPARRTDHEVELVAVIGRECSSVSPEAAPGCLAGWCIGLDLTLRGDEDRGLRKSLDGYTVLGPWLTTCDEAGDMRDRAIALEVNGRPRQAGRTSQMLHGVAELVAFASRYFTLRPGDVLMTGTPAGAGPIVPGDTLDCTVEGLGAMSVAVRGAAPPDAAQR